MQLTVGRSADYTGHVSSKHASIQISTDGEHPIMALRIIFPVSRHRQLDRLVNPSCSFSLNAGRLHSETTPCDGDMWVCNCVEPRNYISLSGSSWSEAPERSEGMIPWKNSDFNSLRYREITLPSQLKPPAPLRLRGPYEYSFISS